MEIKVAVCFLFNLDSNVCPRFGRKFYLLQKEKADNRKSESCSCKPFGLMVFSEPYEIPFLTNN
jgi:hypothetical protein